MTNALELDPSLRQPEQLADPRKQPETLNTKDGALLERQANLVKMLEASGIKITDKDWQKLLPEVGYADLSKNPEASKYHKKYGVWPDNLFATVTPSGKLVVDQEKFFAFNERQQNHILAHEASHRIDHFFRQASAAYEGNEGSNNLSAAYNNILTLIDSTSSEETSYYSVYLDRSSEDSRLKKQGMLSEKVAETFAQYLTSNGLFGDFIKNKLLQFPGNLEGELPVWEQYQESSEKMAELDRFEDMNEEEQQQFLHSNAAIARQYTIFREIRNLLGNSDNIEQALASFNEPEYDPNFDFEFLEYDEMVSSMPMNYASLPSTNQTHPSIKKPSNQSMNNDLLNPFGLFTTLFG